MSTIATDGFTGARNPVLKTESDDFVRLGQVFTFVRAHPPPERVTVRTDRETLDDCLAVPGRAIQKYRPAAPAEWVSYPEIVAAFAARGATSSHTRPFPEGAVFAPVKVVLADSYPLRAYLTYAPTYPWRGQLGVLRRGQPLWMAYAALGVLNSPLGDRLYARCYAERFEGAPRPDGLRRRALSRVPIARVGFDPEHLRRVAQLVSQITGLYEAEVDCQTSFRPLIDDLQELLLQGAISLLGLDEPAARGLLSTEGAVQNPLPFPPSDFVRLLRLPPVRLLTEAEERRLDQLLDRKELDPDEAATLDRLKRLRFWQHAVNHGLPAELEVAQPEAA